MSLWLKFKERFINLRNYFPIYFQSVFFLRLLQVIVVLPLLSYLFIQVLKVTGLTSITESNLMIAIQNPLALVVIALIGLITVFFIYYEQAYYVVLAYLQRSHQDYHLRTVLRKIHRKARYFLSFQSLLFLLYFVLILPIASLGMSAGLADNLYLPHFIGDELVKSTQGFFIYFGSLLVLFYLSLRLIYTVIFFVIEEELSIFGAIKKSWQYTKGKCLKTIGFLVITLGIYALMIGLVTATLLLPLIVIEPLFSVCAPFVAGFILTLLQIVLFFSFGFLQMVLADGLLCFAYPKLEQASPLQPTSKPFLFKRPFFFYGALSLFFLIAFGANTASLTKILYQPNTQIVAHRGYMASGVENTISALQAAAKQGADYVEMDVLETKDHQLVVFHDRTLSRLTNRQESINELTLAELQEITVHSGGFEDRIPSFEEYVQAAITAEMKLVVELKYYGWESPEMEANVVKILQKYNVTQSYLVQSLKEESIVKVKALDPNIRTGYLVAFNIGNLPATSADFVVIEEFSLNERLVEQARQVGKGIMTWTVNEEDLVRRALRLNIDGIITNEPSQAKRVRQSFEENRTLVERVKELL